MWLLIILGILNSILSFIANYMIRFSALDITPAAVMILAQKGDGVLIPAIVMLCAYNFVSPKDFSYIWITFPMAILAGYLYTWIGSGALVLLVYHLLGAVSAFFFGYLRPKYAGFMVVNFALNYGIIKVSYLFL